MTNLFLQNRIKKSLLVINVLFLSSCITFVKNPGSYRKKNKSLISVGRGETGNSAKYTYHILDSVGLGVGLDGNVSDSLVIKTSQKYASVNPLNAEGTEIRKIFQRTERLNVHSLYFPWKKSSFFVGLNAALASNQFAYNEETEQFALDGIETNVEWLDRTYEIGIPIGLSKNTTENMNFIAGFAPTKIISTQRSFIDNGEKNEVDQGKRDAAISSFDGRRSSIEWRLMGSFGVAF